MDDLGIAIAEKLIEVTASAVIKEICKMWGYESQLKDLNKTVCTIKNVLLDADSKRELSHEVRNFIVELKAAIYDADDLFDEFITLAELKLLDDNKDDNFLEKVCHFFCGKKKEVSQAFRMSCRVKDIKEQLDTIVSNHQKFKLSADNNPIIRRNETCSHVNAGDIIGREDDVEVVINMLLGTDEPHDNIRFVTIVGVGGLGKTTLAQLVYNDIEVKVEFPDDKLRLWVCVSDQDGEQFDVKSILCKILELVANHKPDSTSTMQWVQKQFQEQLRGKKYLLVLDDVWNEDCEKWRYLCTFLTLGHEGSRIVVTTRSEMTARIIGENHTHKLQGLSKENSWLLFKSLAFDKGDHEHANQLELVEIGKKIVEKCYNIPLAIKVVGNLLFGQPVNKWQTFQNHELAEIGNGDNKIMSILKLSYYNLTPSLKSCFRYCALFPKDIGMKKEELIRLWMAQGYIVPLDRGQSLEDAAEEYLLILVRRCFFQDVTKDYYGDIEQVKMHDLMHDVALEVGKEEIGIVSSNTTELRDNVRHVSYAGVNYPPNFYSKRKIRSFILSSPSTIQIDGQINSWMRLRVLNLQYAGMKRLPDSIGKLLHLRYLDLSWNFNLEALSDSITRLHNLQTLVLSYCEELRELPKAFSKLVKLRYLDLSGCDALSSLPSGMGELTNLRHLDLIGCDGLSSMPSDVGKLTNLRVLPFFVVGMENRVTTEEEPMGELNDLKALTNLKGFIRIQIGRQYMNNDGGDEYLKGLKYLSEIEIVFYEDEDDDNEGDEDEDDDGDDDDDEDEDDDDDDDEDEDEDDGCLESESVMEKLKPPSNVKEFTLKNYKGTAIPGWGRAEDSWAKSFQYLVDIRFIGCCNLEQIPSLSELRFLKHLYLSNLRKLEYIGDKSSNIGSDREVLTTFFPSLKFLNIWYLDSLKGWWREEELVDDDNDPILSSRFTFPCLKKLMIRGCPHLTSFPSCTSLEDLDLFKSNKMLRVRLNAGISHCYIRSRIVQTDDLGVLRSIHSQFITYLHITKNENMESLSEYGEVLRSCASFLRRLRISYCPSLQRIGKGGLEHLTALESLELSNNHQLSFDDDIPWRSLYRLHSMSIAECNGIKSLPESIWKLASLKKLEIVVCPIPKEQCKIPNGKNWPKIYYNTVLVD